MRLLAPLLLASAAFAQGLVAPEITPGRGPVALGERVLLVFEASPT